VGLKSGLDAVVKRKIPSPRRESNPDHPIVHPIASRYTDLSITAPENIDAGTLFVMFKSRAENVTTKYIYIYIYI
jgi:hypothetical protein